MYFKRSLSDRLFRRTENERLANDLRERHEELLKYKRIQEYRSKHGFMEATRTDAKAKLLAAEDALDQNESLRRFLDTRQRQDRDPARMIEPQRVPELTALLDQARRSGITDLDLKTCAAIANNCYASQQRLLASNGVRHWASLPDVDRQRFIELEATRQAYWERWADQLRLDELERQVRNERVVRPVGDEVKQLAADFQEQALAFDEKYLPKAGPKRDAFDRVSVPIRREASRLRSEEFVATEQTNERRADDQRPKGRLLPSTPRGLSKGATLSAKNLQALIPKYDEPQLLFIEQTLASNDPQTLQPKYAAPHFVDAVPTLKPQEGQASLLSALPPNGQPPLSGGRNASPNVRESPRASHGYLGDDALREKLHDMALEGFTHASTVSEDLAVASELKHAEWTAKIAKRFKEITNKIAVSKSRSELLGLGRDLSNTLTAYKDGLVERDLVKSVQMADNSGDSRRSILLSSNAGSPGIGSVGLSRQHQTDKKK